MVIKRLGRLAGYLLTFLIGKRDSLGYIPDYSPVAVNFAAYRSHGLTVRIEESASQFGCNLIYPARLSLQITKLQRKFDTAPGFLGGCDKYCGLGLYQSEAVQQLLIMPTMTGSQWARLWRDSSIFSASSAGAQICGPGFREFLTESTREADHFEVTLTRSNQTSSDPPVFREGHNWSIQLDDEHWRELQSATASGQNFNLSLVVDNEIPSTGEYGLCRSIHAGRYTYFVAITESSLWGSYELKISHDLPLTV